MRLRKLEIMGFKSLMDRVDMEFSQGITAVVGPNGCGKTNIVDAIRWVLGEQKTRLLRNTKMENVIFNGTMMRKPLGMAEVDLVLSNEDRALPIDYDEVTISRRLYRSGLSEYCVNGEVSRLKAIRGLLFDTGLGNHAYSIIEREMIDAVLNEKDQDKKHLLEEAAGIMRYRVQRDESLRKIKLTEEDITRLNDILSELEKEIRSLRYQKGKAQRFLKLRNKVDEWESALLKRNLYELLIECKKVREEKSRQEEVTLVDENEITIKESNLQENRLKTTELEHKLQESHEKRYKLSKELQRNDEKIAINKERITKFKERIAEDEEEIAGAEKRLGELERNLKELDRESLEKQELLKGIGEEVSCKEQECKSLVKEYKLKKDLLGRKKQFVLDLSGGAQLKNHFQGSLKELEEKRQHVAEESIRLRIIKHDLQSKAAELKREYESKRNDSASIRENLDLLYSRRERINRQIAQCDQQLANTTIELNRLKEKKKLLEVMREEHGIDGLKERDSIEGVRGILAEHVHVPREYRKCFEAVLAPFVRGLLVDTHEKALTSLKKLAKCSSKGLSILYPVEASFSQPSFDDKHAIPAIDLVECESDFHDHVRALLDGVVVTKNLEHALEILERSPQSRVATPEGFFFAGPGRIFVAPEEDIELTLLDFESKTMELGEAQDRMEENLSRLQQRGKRLSSIRNDLGEQIRTNEDQLKIGIEEEEKKRKALYKIEIEAIKARERRAALESSIAEFDKDISELKLKLRAISDPASKDEAGKADDEIKSKEKELSGLEADKERLQTEISELKLEEARTEGELKTVVSRMDNLQNLKMELQGLIKARGDDAIRSREQVLACEEEISALSSVTFELHGAKEEVEKDIETLKGSYEEVKKVCDDLESELRRIKQQMEEKKEALHKISLSLTSVEMKMASCIEKAKEKFSLDLNCFVEDSSLFNLGEWENLDMDRFDEFKRKMEHFGPVNMLAVEEYEDKKQRYDFLIKQKKDLEEARESLLQGIRRINREARQLLSETFEKVRNNFKATFISLFDGGEADLLFVDSDDPLEANVKIVANPKGKKLHDISSLSGGERALVALSLLFAVYLVKPSPFCIFDEVDAPLDDANVARFVNMLRSFTDRTQFIIITHNKKTMEAADFLYGVTMEEPGVSSMISVKMADVDKLKKLSIKPTEVPGKTEEIPVQA